MGRDHDILIKKIERLQEIHRQGIALHQQGLEEATLIMSLLTGGVSTPPKTQNKKEQAIVKALTRRNSFINKKAAGL